MFITNYHILRNMLAIKFLTSPKLFQFSNYHQDSKWPRYCAKIKFLFLFWSSRKQMALLCSLKCYLCITKDNGQQQAYLALEWNLHVSKWVKHPLPFFKNTSSQIDWSRYQNHDTFSIIFSISLVKVFLQFHDWK